MVVGCLQNVIVGPIVLGHIREQNQSTGVIRNILLVGLAPQQAVDNGNDLGAGNFIVGLEGAVAVAYYPAIPGGVLNVARCPMAGGHIPKAAVFLHDGGIAVSIGVKEPHRHGRELGAGDGLVSVEQAVGVAHSDAVAGQIGDISGVPCVCGYIRESGFCGGGNTLPVALGQQAGKFLKFKTGEFSRNLFANLDREISIYVNMLIRNLKKEDVPQNRESAVIKKSTGKLMLHVLRKFVLESWYYLIWFEEWETSTDTEETHSAEESERAELERELRISQDSLMQALEEIEHLKNKYEVSNEKLQSANEELVVINDELQVANAELTATNRKLVRVNSELTVANQKLTERNGEFQKKVNKILELSDRGGRRSS